MDRKVTATATVVRAYRELFVNRLAYTVQSSRPHPETGRHYYYRPNRKGQPVPLSHGTLERHLEGKLTVGFYAINPKTQRCKWVAIDADYENAFDDLLNLQWNLRHDGVEAALERSRRGAHLWIFGETPLLASDCRLYIYHLAKKLKVPVKGSGLAEGIEIFPRQDTLQSQEFGNAIRGPLGIHRASNERYWFYAANYSLEEQIAYLQRLKKVTELELAGFVKGLTMPPELMPAPNAEVRPFKRALGPNRREFRILDYVGKKRKIGRDYYTRCPSCAKAGRDRSGDNLAISVADPRFYHCWAGCTREMIRAALGCPIRRAIAG